MLILDAMSLRIASSPSWSARDADSDGVDSMVPCACSDGDACNVSNAAGPANSEFCDSLRNSVFVFCSMAGLRELVLPFSNVFSNVQDRAHFQRRIVFVCVFVPKKLRVRQMPKRLRVSSAKRSSSFSSDLRCEFRCSLLQKKMSTFGSAQRTTAGDAFGFADVHELTTMAV